MSEPDTTPHPQLRPRNSLSTSPLIPTKLTLPTNATVSPHPLHFDLLSYTSLKDLLPSSAVNSPTSAAASTYEISIRNRLVKQAAWAYLQPMSSSPDASAHHFFRRMWLRFCQSNPVLDCLRFITLRVISSIGKLFDRLLRAIRLRTTS